MLVVFLKNAVTHPPDQADLPHVTKKEGPYGRGHTTGVPLVVLLAS
jgi:hypothetical protein